MEKGSKTVWVGNLVRVGNSSDYGMEQRSTAGQGVACMGPSLWGTAENAHLSISYQALTAEIGQELPVTACGRDQGVQYGS